MQKNCFCYTVSLDYIFPAAVSAIQIKNTTPASIADVFIVCFDDSKHISSEITNVLSAYDIKLIHVPKSELDGLSLTYARLFLDKLLPIQYENIVYIDADTQVLNSLEGMFEPSLSKYDFLAARDATTLVINSNTKIGNNTKNYLKSIGIEARFHENYFNAGVIKFKRNILESVRPEAKRILAKSGHIFIHFDQDVLNIILSGKSERMSIKWNFPAFLMGYSHYLNSPTHILHFCSNPRPWHGPFVPWGEKYFEIYTEFAKILPNVGQKTQPLRGLKNIKYILQMRYKSIFERITWDSKYSRDSLIAQEKETLF